MTLNGDDLLDVLSRRRELFDEEADDDLVAKAEEVEVRRGALAKQMQSQEKQFAANREAMASYAKRVADFEAMEGEMEALVKELSAL